MHISATSPRLRRSNLSGMCPVYTPPGTPSPLWGVTHAAITAVHKNARSLAENFPAEQSLIPVDRSYSLFPIPYSLFPIPYSLPSKNNNGLRTNLRPLPVNCWDWTKAIALPRVPETRPVIPQSAGANLGSWARCPRPQSPHVTNYWNNLFA